MLLPNFIYGLSGTAKKRCEKLGKTVTSSQHYVETMLSMGMRDTAADPQALLVVHGPSPRLARTEAFQLYAPLSMILFQQLFLPCLDQLVGEIFHESLKTAWGTQHQTPNQKNKNYVN